MLNYIILILLFGKAFLIKKLFDKSKQIDILSEAVTKLSNKIDDLINKAEAAEEFHNEDYHF